MKQTLLLLFITSGFFGCFSDSGPENSLEGYVKYRFQSDSIEKDKLLSYLGGPLAEQIETLESASFEKMSFKDKYELKDFDLIKMRCPEETNCFATYSLRYNFLDKGKVGSESYIKEVAQLTNTDGNWRIINVDNIKTLHDSREIKSCPQGSLDVDCDATK